LKNNSFFFTSPGTLHSNQTFITLNYHLEDRNYTRVSEELPLNSKPGHRADIFDFRVRERLELRIEASVTEKRLLECYIWMTEDLRQLCDVDCAFDDGQ
jgi:hypothetical protein